MTFDLTDGVTPEHCNVLLANLQAGLVTHFTLSEKYPSGAGVRKRMVVAPLPSTTEIMIAIENDGCAFLSPDTNINQFMFVSRGFSLASALAATGLIDGMKQAYTDLLRQGEHHFHQLTHQDRSQD